MKKLLNLQCALNSSDVKLLDITQSNIIMNPNTLSILIDKLWSDNDHLGSQPDSRILKLVIYWGERKLESSGKYSYGAWRTLGFVQTVDASLTSRDAYKDYILKKYSDTHDSYYSMDYNTFYIAYGYVDSNNSLTLSPHVKTIDRVPVEEIIIDEVPRLVVPSADPKDWSSTVNVLSDKITQFSLDERTFTFTLSSDEMGHKSHVVCSTPTLVKLYEFTDIIPDLNNLKSFTRVFSKQSRSYENSILQYTTDNDTKYIKYLPKTGKFNFNVITMDLETRLSEDKVMEPVSISTYSKSREYNATPWLSEASEYKTYYLTDFDNCNEMIGKSILDLLIPEFNGYHVYLHNFSKFDGVFILKTLAKAVPSKDIKFLVRDRNLLSITVSYNYNKTVDGKVKKLRGHISFHDSLLILPGSLSKLAKNFGVLSKGEFDISKLNNISWSNLLNIRNELLNYNKRDCKVLYEILLKFALGIHEQYQINITKYPTLSSIAFAIYRSNYLRKNFNIPITNKKEYDRLCKSYRGGHVDVYIPYGENLYCYDINSLYPYVMHKYEYPVGKAKYFDKPVGKFSDLNNIFGVIQVHVTCPEDMKLPILLHRYKDPVTKEVSTLCPTGKWTGWYFTEELKYAVTLGYKFEIIRGYHYDQKAKIFNKYVKDLYDMRSNYPKSDARNLIAKLLLNSLYGRFGMSIYVMCHKLVSLCDFAITDSFDEVIDIGEDHALIGINEVMNINNEGSMINTSVAIASAITAYARITIHKFKLSIKDYLHYKDTDSIFTSKPLQHMVGNKLGQMKLEYDGPIQKAVFLGPKLYALKFADGSEIVKIKGCKTKCTFSDMLNLLDIGNESSPLYQEKWIRNFKDGNISLQTQPYNFTITENKRSAIVVNGKFVGTKARVINDLSSS